MEFRYQVGDEIKTVQIEREGDGLGGDSRRQSYRVSIEDRVYAVSVDLSASDVMRLRVNDEQHNVIVAQDGSTRFVAVDGNVITLSVPDSSRARRRHHAGEDSLTASMPGQVIKVLVSDGDEVERGQTLVILEAMKMEIRVSAPHEGRVAKVHIDEGQVVDRGDVLVELVGE